MPHRDQPAVGVQPGASDERAVALPRRGRLRRARLQNDALVSARSVLDQRDGMQVD